MFSADEARELLRLIEEAYTVLGNPGLRRSYDEARSNGATAPVMPLTQVAQQNHSTPPVMAVVHQAAPQPMAAPPPPPPMNSYAAAANSNYTNHNSVNQQMTQAAHQALPDFANPILGTGAFSQPVSSKHTLPPGTGRTQLSTYKIDENFEGELGNTGDWDGGLLQRARLYKNISIDRLSEATRISRPYLMAIETNDFKSLPAAVFVRGFVVQVARVLGLNDAKVATSYMKMFRAGGGK
jgi:curved DNA-binding protein CbpA